MDWAILALALAAILVVQVVGFRVGYRQSFRLTPKLIPLLIVGWGAVFLGFMIRQARTNNRWSKRTRLE